MVICHLSFCIKETYIEVLFFFYEKRVNKNLVFRISNMIINQLNEMKKPFTNRTRTGKVVESTK